jgi:hypothetical protein
MRSSWRTMQQSARRQVRVSGLVVRCVLVCIGLVVCVLVRLEVVCVCKIYPSEQAVQLNAQQLADYAAICQAAGRLLC